MEKLTHFKEWNSKAVSVGHCFTNQFYVDRFKRVCLNSPQASHVSNLLDRFQTKPDEGRFGNLMEFLDDLLPLKTGMQRFFDDARFRVVDNDAKTDGEFVDLAKVTQFIVDAECWHYANMLLCLGMGWLDVAYYSRGCQCHRSKDIDAEGCFTYYRRKKAQQAESKLDFNCPAKGLHADEFACGKGMELLRESYARYRRFLTTDLHDVTREGRHRIMADYDVGVDHSMYIATLKFTPHRQLPLSLSGMANRNPDKAAEAARACLN